MKLAQVLRALDARVCSKPPCKGREIATLKAMRFHFLPAEDGNVPTGNITRRRVFRTSSSFFAGLDENGERGEQRRTRLPGRPFGRNKRGPIQGIGHGTVRTVGQYFAGRRGLQHGRRANFQATAARRPSTSFDNKLR